MKTLHVIYGDNNNFKSLVEVLETKYKVKKETSSNKYFEVYYEGSLIYTSKDNFSSEKISSKTLINKIKNSLNNKIKYRGLKQIDGSDSIPFDEY